MKTISVQIGGRVFSTNCPDGEETALERATQKMDESFIDIRRNAPSFPFEQILLLAALDIIVSQQHALEDLEQRYQSLDSRLHTIMRLFDQEDDPEKPNA